MCSNYAPGIYGGRTTQCHQAKNMQGVWIALRVGDEKDA